MLAAFLEDFLTDAIRTRLLHDESVLDQFLSGMGPLATFSAKIEIAYLLRIATIECKQAMHIVRHVRNEFAHNPEPITFRTPRIKDMCSHLIKQRDARQFMMEQLSVELNPETIPELLDRMGPKIVADNPSGRDMYINTVKIISFCFAVGIS